MSANQKKRVLLVSPSSGRGGAESILLQIIDQLSNKYDLILLTHRGENELLTENLQVKKIYQTSLFNGALEIDTNWLNLLMFPIGQIKNFFLVWKIIRSEKIDLVISNSSTIIYPGAAARLCGKKSLTIFHEMINNKFLRLSFFNSLNKNCQKLIFNSRFLQSQFPKTKKAEVLSIGLSQETFSKLSNIKKKSGGELTIGQVGKIYKTKGTDLFAQVAKKVLSKSKVSFVAFGDVLDKHFFDQIISSIEENNLSEWIKFQPYKPITGILDNIDLLLATSRFETFGMVTLEAMAAGVPVISFKVGVAPEIIKNGENGFLVENYNVEKMTEIILQIQAGKFDIGKIGQTAKKTVVNNYLGSFAEKLEILLGGDWWA
ncbi:MAG: glycosyltransferase [Candidatus Berkelbacteria bacterium]